MNNTKDLELIEYESINSEIIRCVSECFNDYRAMVRLHIDSDYDGWSVKGDNCKSLLENEEVNPNSKNGLGVQTTASRYQLEKLITATMFSLEKTSQFE